MIHNVKLTSKCEYALLALAYLARNCGDGKLVTADEISAAQDIPRKFLEQILLVLKRGGYVKSTKGQNGGFRLARPAEKISLAEIIRLMDGALAPTESVSRYFYDSTPIEREKGLLSVFREIRDHISDKLESTFLADGI